MFWGENCEILYEYKLNAEEKVRKVFEAAEEWEPTTHHEAIDIIISLYNGVITGVLAIRDVSTALDKITEVSDLIDKESYPLIYQDIMSIPAILTPYLSWYMLSQLSLPDKSYDWDEPSRRLVGSETESDIREALHSLIATYEHAYENLETIYDYSSYTETSGWKDGMIEVTSSDEGTWQEWCTENRIGRNYDGYNLEKGTYRENYECYSIDDFSDGLKLESTASAVYINSDTEAVGNKLFLVDIAQYLAAYITESERAVTNLVFVGSKAEDGTDVALDTVDVILVLADDWSGDVDQVQCGALIYDETEETRIISEDVTCSMSTDTYYDNRIRCSCEIDAGWVVGYITADDAETLIEESRADGEYEVAFGARAILSMFLGLIYLVMF